MRPVSRDLPKPMLPIGDKPIVWHIMKAYAACGITDFVLCLGYKGWLIKEFFLNYRAMTADITVHLGPRAAVDIHDRTGEEGWRVTLAETGLGTQTGGRLTAVRRYVEQDELFCLTYGDGVANLDFHQLIAFHRSHGKIATITAVRPPSRFGEIRVDNGLVWEFNEKPQTAEGFINGGFFVFDARRLWEYLDAGPQCALEQEPLRRLAAARQLAAFQHTGFWQPMDTPREYALLNELWRSGTAPWKTWTSP